MNGTVFEPQVCIVPRQEDNTIFKKRTLIMRGVFLVVTFILLVAMAGCRTPTAIVAERQPTDFSEMMPEELAGIMEYDEKSGFYYLFEYDQNNLYLTLAVKDQTLQRKIVNFGFTVWIDTDGGDEQKQGFRYPVGLPSEGEFGEFRRQQDEEKDLLTGDMRSMLKRADNIDLIGIYGTSVRRVKVRDSRIPVKAGFVSDIMIYEAAVPFEALKYGYSPADEGSTVGLGLETGYLERRSPSEREMPPGVEPGTGTRQPGGMYGGTPRRMPDTRLMDASSSEIEALAEPTELWIKLKFNK